jgi:hypothetical protein
MQKLRLWDVVNLHSFQLTLAESAVLFPSELLIS